MKKLPFLNEVCVMPGCPKTANFFCIVELYRPMKDVRTMGPCCVECAVEYNLFILSDDEIMLHEILEDIPYYADALNK